MRTVSRIANFFWTTGAGGSNVKSMKLNGKMDFLSAVLRVPPLMGGVLAILVFLLSAGTLTAADSPTTYQTWVKPWASRPAPDATSPNVIVSIVAGEAEPGVVAGMTQQERLTLSFHLKISATEITTNGACRSYFISNTSTQTAEPRQLLTTDLQKLTELLAHLPDDDSRLPPAGRRVVVQVWEGGAWHVHVYDGRKLPTEIKSLLDQLANPLDALL